MVGRWSGEQTTRPSPWLGPSERFGLARSLPLGERPAPNVYCRSGDDFAKIRFSRRRDVGVLRPAQ
jgi:hypothetical protein